jgi:hypothetical protein
VVQKKGDALLGWTSGSRSTSQDKNDVVILKNHEALVPDEDDEGMSRDNDDWLYDDSRGIC